MPLSGWKRKMVADEATKMLNSINDYQADQWLNELATDLRNYGYPRSA